MAKTSGLLSALYVAQYDLSGDVGAVTTIETSQAQFENPGINQAAISRIGLLRDGAISFASFWNTSAGQSVPVLEAAPRGDVIVSYFQGSTVGNAAASMTAKQINYPIVRGPDGSLGA